MEQKVISRIIRFQCNMHPANEWVWTLKSWDAAGLLQEYLINGMFGLVFWAGEQLLFWGIFFLFSLLSYSHTLWH